jgi:hypothetical protein
MKGSVWSVWAVCVDDLRRPLFAACFALGLFGCAPEQGSRYDVIVRVESDPGRSLAGAKLLRDGALLGTSDARGVIPLRLGGATGEVVELEAACPSGHRSPAKPLRVVLRPLVEQGRKAEYHVACPPLLRSLVVSVRAQNGPGLPVKYLGKEIARTDSTGAAHALLKVMPDETVTVTLDTSAPEHAGLMPQNPELKLTMPARDDVVLFDQTFTRAEAATKKQRVRKGPRRL